jgi:hypothetical protein
VGARIFGVVLNNVNLPSEDYYYSRGYYHDSYRANGNGKGSGNGNGNGNGNGANGNGNHAVSARKDKGLHVS